MSVKVRIPTALRQYVNNLKDVETEGATVQDLLSNLTDQHPDIKKNLFDDEGKLRNFVVVYVDDEDIRYLQGMETPVKEGNLVAIAASIAGGKLG